MPILAAALWMVDLLAGSLLQSELLQQFWVVVHSFRNASLIIISLYSFLW
jgi:hypothetical protein